MAEETNLNVSIQELIATAIALSPDENSSTITNLVESTLFNHPLDEIVLRCTLYRKKFNGPPGKSHIDDVFADIMEDKSHKEHTLYNRIINNMIRQEDELNTKYLLSEVLEFMYRRRWRAGVEQIATRYQKGGPNLIEDLEALSRANLRIRIQEQDYGTLMSSTESLSFFNKSERSRCLLGIHEFDVGEVNPARGELFIFLAARNRGKSMFLNQCGKLAILQGWKVMHYTLENSVEMTAQRYFQSLFSGVKRHGSYYATYFTDGEEGETRIESKKLVPNFFINESIRSRTYLINEMKRWNFRLENLRIKAYPTGRMSFDDLQRDLDDLALVEKFIPDMVLVDYPQIMRLDRKIQRHEALNNLVIDLRGLAVERNIAMVVPQQGNRSSENAGMVQGFMGGGSIEMLATADNCITYSQTASEEKQKIARLYAQKVRNDTARFSVYISQHYPTAQFVMDSRPVTDKMRDAIKAYVSYDPGEEEEGEEDFEEPKKYGRKK